MFTFPVHLKNIYLSAKMHNAANTQILSGGRRAEPREGLPLRPQHR